MLNNYILHAPEFIIIFIILVIVTYFYNFNMIYAVIYLMLILYFFRGWKNKHKQLDDNTIYSPCEGRILDIQELEDYYHIAIFLNVHNIHVQYSPVKGIIKSINHYSGTFVPAYFFEKSKYNERLETVIATDFGDVKFVQIAGQLARRIKTFKKINEEVKQLDPIGLIKLGSRCDLYLPKNKVDIQVKKNQFVKIGDIIATLI